MYMKYQQNININLCNGIWYIACIFQYISNYGRNVQILTRFTPENLDLVELSFPELVIAEGTMLRNQSGNIYSRSVHITS